ncbi:LON peptidase substrate-binding domain-containing protein [Spongisporangium articulatum]|uniref:LON peptidase substrate-binding domain-containing protein n=1 Tax=Spongisporangium articulatum TaxID=3362603 RepID=A0ABW8ASP3_9ACTN
MPAHLPLFPLGTVLVPGLVLPLHIFEPRYRELVADLQDKPEDQRLFGVIAARSVEPATLQGTELPDAGTPALPARSRFPELFRVGCTALVQEVTSYDDGRYDIVAVGQDRFRLVQLLPDAGTSYLTAQVEYLDEPDGEDEVTYLAELVGLRFAAYRERLRVEQSGVPTDPRVLSYLVAAAAALDLRERQQLLEAGSTAERLRAELALLRREIGLLDAFAALPAVDLPRAPIAPN